MPLPRELVPASGDSVLGGSIVVPALIRSVEPSALSPPWHSQKPSWSGTPIPVCAATARHWR